MLGVGALPDLVLLSFQRKLYVSSQWELSQVPLDLCDVYVGGCHGCLMARDPYCGWDQGHCVSIYSSPRYVVARVPCPWEKVDTGIGEVWTGCRRRQSWMLGRSGGCWEGDEGREGLGLSSGVLSFCPPNSRRVLQSINLTDPHKQCPSPKPGTGSGPARGPRSMRVVQLCPHRLIWGKYGLVLGPQADRAGRSFGGSPLVCGWL